VAAAPGADPVAAVRETLARVQSVISSQDTRPIKLEALHALARELLDTRAMGHQALGRELRAQPPEQQREFLELFDELVVRHYLQRLLLFRDPDFDLVGGESGAEGVLVRTRIVTRRDAYAVDYEMRRREGRWRAADIVVEGISVTRSYHTQFQRLLRSQSFEEVLGRMRRKIRVLDDSGDS
jgi:phospholipid transport system substrate-binding protein